MFAAMTVRIENTLKKEVIFNVDEAIRGGRVGELLFFYFFYSSIISHGHGQGGDSMIKQKKLK